MTPARLVDVLGILRWGSRHLADLLNVEERTVRRWMVGQMSVPPRVADWIEELGQAAEMAALASIIARAPRAPGRPTGAWEDRT